jgi:putative sigma-54 modulation protein
MNLQITGLNIDITAAIREYIETKLSRITRHVDNVISTTVTLSVEREQQKAEVDLHLAGKNLHVESTENDLYAAIDILMDKLDRMVLKHKEKATSHRTVPSGQFTATEE